MYMKPHSKNLLWLRPGLASLVLFCAAGLVQAQTAQDFVVSQFDDGSTQGWSYNYGAVNPSLGFTVENDPTMNRGPVGAGPGAMKVYAPFDLCTGAINTDYEKVLAAPLDLTKYTKLHLSVYVDTNSAHCSDWAAGALGSLTPHIRLASWGGDVTLGAANADNAWVTADYGNWHDYTVTIDQLSAAKLPTLQACGILGINEWAGWGTCAAPIGLTNAVTYWVDNIWFEWNTNQAPAAPPKVGLQKAGTHGVMIALGTSGQWERQAISTPAPDGAYIWTAQGGYPVSYSCTITSFPPIGTHLGYEAHMYIANGDTAGTGNNVVGGPDWNCPDIFIFRVENARTTVLTTNADTTITTNYNYDAMAQIQWKTNMPANNATNIPVVVRGPSVVGTWTVTFSDATHGSLSGPGITTTNFTLPEGAVTSNFSPSTSFVQFGNFKNDGANDGHNNDATGTFSHVKITGTAAPIDDDFSGATLTNKYAWRKTHATEVQYIAPGTAWFLNWTVPAFGFTPNVASLITGPWVPMTLPDQYTIGTNVYAAVPASALPAGNKAFFAMINRPFSKLQVLWPGETNAPGTVTGKVGTPLPQQSGVPIDITINGCDSAWYIVSSTDTVHLTATPDGAFLPPDTDLVNGTVTISQNLLLGSGTWTITASDLDNTNVVNGVSSPLTIP
jgi:hypothetical protein